MSRVMVLVLDSLGREWFDKHRVAGRWPNLDAAARDWTRLDVASNGEALHGAVWPTFATGTHEGKHGRYYAIQWLAEEMRLVFCEDSRLAVAPFWSALQPGLRATVIDVPYVSLVEREGFRSLVGWGLHVDASPQSVPASFGDEVRARFGRHPLKADTVEPASARDKLRLVRDLRRGVHLRSQLVLDLAARRDWELLVVNFDEPHAAGHYLAFDQRLSPRLDAAAGLREVVRPFDTLLPRIVAAAGDDCHVMVVSLHGMRPQAEYSKLANRVVDLLRDPAGALEPPRDDLVRRLRGLLPASVHRSLWGMLPAAVRARRVAAVQLAAAFGPGDPGFTVPGEVWAQVRLNVAGRERDGVLAPDEAEAWLDRLEAELPRYRTDAGEPAFTGLWRRSREVSGPRASRLPDAMVKTNPAVRQTASLRRDDDLVIPAPEAEARNGVHTGEGFCLWRPALGARAARRDVHILDFAPSIVELLGGHPAPDLDGASFVG